MNLASAALRGPGRQLSGLSALSPGTSLRLSTQARAGAGSSCQVQLHKSLWSRPFHATSRSLVKVGDAVPDVEVMEGSPGNKISLAKELGSGKGVIVGVPAAFSPSCTASHIPGYIKSPKLKEAGKVFVVAVNDAFVMKAWGDQLDPKSSSGVRFVADPSAALVNALDLAFDGSAIFGGDRAKRFALLIEDGKVREAFVEPDNTGVDVSAAEKVLK